MGSPSCLDDQAGRVLNTHMHAEGPYSRVVCIKHSFSAVDETCAGDSMHADVVSAKVSMKAASTACLKLGLRTYTSAAKILVADPSNVVSPAPSTVGQDMAKYYVACVVSGLLIPDDRLGKGFLSYFNNDHIYNCDSGSVNRG